MFEIFAGCPAKYTTRMSEAILPHSLQSSQPGAPTLKATVSIPYNQTISMNTSTSSGYAYGPMSAFSNQSLASNVGVPVVYSFTNIKASVYIQDIVNQSGNSISTGISSGTLTLYPYQTDASNGSTVYTGPSSSINLGILSKYQTVSVSLPNMYLGNEVANTTRCSRAGQVYIYSSRESVYQARITLSGTVTKFSLSDE